MSFVVYDQEQNNNLLGKYNEEYIFIYIVIYKIWSYNVVAGGKKKNLADACV